MHTGSDILDIEVFIHAEILFEAASKFKDLDFIDFGSGFKVPYFPGDNETNIEELGKKLSKRFNEFCLEYGKELTLAFEPGKFLVSEAGNFLCSVNSKNKPLYLLYRFLIQPFCTTHDVRIQSRYY